MSRSIRIQYDGAWYHVMNRGAERGYKLLELREIAGIKCYQTVSHAARQFEFISQQDDKIAAMYLRALEIINFTASYPSEAQ